MQLIALPALADNYIWLLHDDRGQALVVDPGESAPVEEALQARELQLAAIVLTHHHHDHIGAAAELRARHGAVVFAPHDERIDAVDHRVAGGTTIAIERPACRFEVLAVPGHTLSHVAYQGHGYLFCGDTLFSMGCGRLFEGTAPMMLDSLDRLAALPADTLVCAGHEYTASNGRFAAEVEGRHPSLAARLDEVASLRAQGRPTMPVSLERERATNPFLRVDEPGVVAWAARQHPVPGDRVARFAALRTAKDGFRG